MMKVRPAQMEAFGQALLADFAAELLAGFERDAPELLHGLPPQERRARVLAALQRGRSHGLDDPVALAEFVSCVLTLGPAFDRHPVVQAMLAEGAPTPLARWRRLRAAMPSRVWDELALLAGARGWQAAGGGVHGH